MSSRSPSTGEVIAVLLVIAGILAVKVTFWVLVFMGLSKYAC